VKQHYLRSADDPSLRRRSCWNADVPDPGEYVELEQDFSAIALKLFGSGTVTGTLERIVSLAASSVDGCDEAAVLLVAEGRASTAAASGPWAAELDELQIGAGEGPCVDAAVEGALFYASDLIDDVRWPAFGPAAVAAGLRSVLAYSLSAKSPSALNLYARLPEAFSATARAQCQLFATMARLALDSAEERAASELRAENLTEALRTRELIGQAQGILMERERITAEQAFDVLRRASQQVNVKLRSVAETLVQTGETPSTGEPQQRRRDRD
jgi:hypothetical protein